MKNSKQENCSSEDDDMEKDITSETNNKTPTTGTAKQHKSRGKEGQQLKTINLKCLNERTWLNDQVINEYFQLLSHLDENNMMFTTYFHTAFRQGGFQKVKNYYKKYNILEYETIFIPVHKENHWFLITFTGDELVTYDPYNYPQASEDERKQMLKKNEQQHTEMLTQLKNEYFKPLFQQKNKQWNELVLKVKVTPYITAQNNSTDCGVFLATFSKCLVLNDDLEFNTKDMINIRKTMRNELETGQIMNT